jgi:hypothetical protein
LRSVFVTPGKGVESGSCSQRETSDTEKNGHLSLGHSNEVGSDDIGDDMDTTGDHVVQNRLEGIETEARDDERTESRYTARDERHAEDADHVDPLLGVE